MQFVCLSSWYCYYSGTISLHVFFTFLLLSGLVAHYTMTSADISDCKQALAAVTEVLGSLRSIIAELENTEKLIELQQDVGGVEELVKQGRVSVLPKVHGC